MFFRELYSNQRETLRLLNVIQQELNRMSQEMDNLTAAVKANTDAEDSAIALIQGIAKQLADAKQDPAKIQALADELNAKATALGAAVTANT
jgi:seryl-tRNA synthetase